VSGKSVYVHTRYRQERYQIYAITNYKIHSYLSCINDRVLEYSAYRQEERRISR
jgi:hypothetical protein